MTDPASEPAQIVGTPRFGLLRLLDQIDTHKAHLPDSAHPGQTRTIWTGDNYHFRLRDKRLRSKHTNYPTMHDWDDLITNNTKIVVRRWRRALGWLCFTALCALQLAVLFGFFLGGGWAIAAGVTVFIAVCVGLAFVANYMMFDRW